MLFTKGQFVYATRIEKLSKVQKIKKKCLKNYSKLQVDTDSDISGSVVANNRLFIFFGFVAIFGSIHGHVNNRGITDPKASTE